MMHRNPIAAAPSTINLAPHSRWDRFLDSVNELYDILRRRVHCCIDYGFRRIRDVLHSRYEERMDASWRAEAERKNTDFEPPLNPDRSLSFFDEYEIINGSPVFTLDVVDERLNHEPLRLDPSAYTISRQMSEAIPALKPTLQRQEGFRMEELKITCFAFSHDDRYIATGLNDGSISIWDAGMGKILWTLADLHHHSIADVAFVAATGELALVSIDIEGLCVQWTLRENGVVSSQMYCSTTWEESGYVGTEHAMPRLSLSGDYVCIPIYTYVEPNTQRAWGSTVATPTSDGDHVNTAQLFCIAFVFSTRMMTMMGRMHPFLTLPVKINEPWVGAERLVNLVEFSRKSKALLLTAYEDSMGYLVLWPYLQSMDVSSFWLHGTRGSFSPDDAYLVTWHCMLSSEKQYQDPNCYVWIIDHLSGAPAEPDRPQWNHPNRKALQHIVLRDPNQGVIHTCDFIRLKDDLGLVSCCVSDKLKVIVWDLKSKTPLHELKTGILKEEVCPAYLRNISGHLRQIDRAHGIRCLSVSRDRQWVGVYSSTSRKGIIWKISEGVEVMRINIPEHKLNSSSGMDLTFSRYSDGILMVGRDRMLLWTPSVLRGFNPADRPVYKLNPADDDISLGYTNICKFSTDGESVGLMRFNADVMTIWRLDVNRRITLIRPSNDQVVWRHSRPEGPLPREGAAFANFAISPDGRGIVTSMMDHSVLLWDLGDVNVCRCISDCFPQQSASLDICFSYDYHHQQTVVVCQDRGVLLWMSLLTQDVGHISLQEPIRSCTFDQQGHVGVIMLDIYRMDVWDIVQRTRSRRLVYQIPLFSCAVSGYGPKLAPNGEFCLVGFGPDGQPVIAREDTKMEDLGEKVYYPDNFMLSADGEWALMYGKISKETDDIMMVERALPNFHDETPADREVLPGIEYRSQTSLTGNRRRTTHSGVRTWKIVRLDGRLKSKQMRLPYKLKPSIFMAMTVDGRRCAVLNDQQQLIVWGTHFTYKSLLQQRHELMEGYHSLTPENIEAKLMEYGPSLTNHPYENGMNLTVECISKSHHTLLYQIINWAKKTGSKLSFEGRITHGQDLLPNVVDLAVARRCQQTIELLLQVMLDGVTSATTLAQILERSLVKLFYKYESLVLKFFKNEKLLKSVGVVHVSEQFLKDRKDYMGVTTDDRMIASEDYIQKLWAGNEKRTMKMQPALQIDVEAEAKVIPFPNIAKMGNEGILQPLLLHTAPHFFFGTELVKGVINYKYKMYGRKLLFEDFYHYLFLLLVFTASAIYAGSERSFGDKSGNSWTTLLVMIVALGNLLHFLKQWHSLWIEAGNVGFLHYMKDYMKMIEFASYILVVFIFPACVWASFAINENRDGKHKDDRNNDLVLGLMAVASVLLWVKLLYYMQAFESTGGMVVMIRETVKDIRWFLLLLFALLVGFGVAFFVLLGGRMTDMSSDSESNDNATATNQTMDMNQTSAMNQTVPEGADFFFQSLFTSMLSVFLLMLSDVGSIAVVIHNSNVKKETRILAFILLVLFLAAVAIVLLNLLIAIMGDSFDRVKNHETTFFLQRRAEVILDMEMGLSRERRKKINEKIERYLHILVPRFQPNVDDWAWEGRIVDLQKRMQMELRRVSNKEQQGIAELREMLRELKELVDARIGASSRLGGSASYSEEYSAS